MSIIKKRVSKKNKSSWRKYVNIKDVEEFLEEKRQEERIGSISDKTNEQLFTIDTKSNEKLLTIKQKRKLNALKPPKNLTALENTSKVQDPLVQRDHVKLKKNGRNLVEELFLPEKSKRIKQSVEDRSKYYDKLDKIISKKKIAKQFRDAWEEEDDPDKKKFLSNEWLNKNLALHNLRNIGKPLVKVHDSARHKTSRAKALDLPHPGISYNPSLKDHQNLLQKVIEKEEKIIKSEKHLNRVTINMFSKVTEDERDSSWRAEISNGIDGEENHSNAIIQLNGDEIEEDENDIVPYRTVNPPVENKKKDKKARRKEKEQREIQKQLQQKKEKKKQITDIHRLKHITTEVLDGITETEQLKKRRKALKEKKKYEPKRISKIKFEEPEIDISMAEDIAGNLRNVKSETNLLVEKFKNFQKRNILPMSIDLGPRKRSKVKRFVRNSHKELPEQLKQLETKKGVKK